MTIRAQEPPDDSVISKQRVKDAFPDRDERKLEMVEIDGKLYRKGPDGLWYQLQA